LVDYLYPEHLGTSGNSILYISIHSLHFPALHRCSVKHDQVNADYPSRWYAFVLSRFPQDISDTLSGLVLAASVDDDQARWHPTLANSTPSNPSQSEIDLTDIKGKVRQLIRRITRTSEPQATIESDRFNIQ
jgi:hypothetical protein